MSWVRTAGLIFLTLIATTLPSSALTVQQHNSREKDSARNSDSQPATQGNSESPADQAPKPATLKIAPNTELWDGSGVRTLSTVTGIASAFVTGLPGGPNLAPEAAPSFPHVVEVETLRSSQRAWLSSHYPHAPPV